MRGRAQALFDFCGDESLCRGSVAVPARHGYLDAPVVRVAAPDVPAVPFSRTMQDYFMPNAEKIANAIRKLAKY